MNKAIGTIVTILTIAGTMSMAASPASSAENTSDDGNTTIIDLDPAPDDYWTPERMKDAEGDDDFVLEPQK